MQLQIIRSHNRGYLVPFHFVLGEPLLHALTEEVLEVFRQPVENFYESQSLHVGLLGLGSVIFYGVNGAAD